MLDVPPRPPHGGRMNNITKLSVVLAVVLAVAGFVTIAYDASDVAARGLHISGVELSSTSLSADLRCAPKSCDVHTS